MIVTSLSVQRLFRRKTVAGISPACLAGRGGPALGGSRCMGVEVSEGRGPVILATPKARVRGCVAQHCRILSASSLRGRPQGLSAARQTEGLGRGSFRM